MNIFYLTHNPMQCAEQHCDKHVVKMILEYAQLLSTAHRIHDENPKVYKKAFINHPSTIWARSSSTNYKWLSMLFFYLCQEYTHRYGKVHVTYKKLWLELSKIPKNIPKGEFTVPPQCMPEDVKHPLCTKKAYQDYYKKYKVHFAKWTNREKPDFMRYA